MGSSNSSTYDSWQGTAVARLLSAQHESGGWGYRKDARPSAEPTAVASIALAEREEASPVFDRAAEWLASTQKQDGAVPVNEQLNDPCWPTALALMAWQARENTRQTHKGSIDRAALWLLKLEGTTFPPAPKIFGHNLGLVGWPWAQGTHSWIEPTSYAVGALSNSGKRNHSRVREGVELILDRTLPEGGWNYGNTRVIDNTLRPFPATTGIALFGLVGEPMDERIKRSVDYLRTAILRVRAPWSLSWGLIGLSVWDALPVEAPELLASCAAELAEREANVLDDALMLWADSLIALRAEVKHGS